MILKIAPAQPGGAPVVVALEQTCTGLPSQWEGTLEDGRSLYARYRGGLLRVGVGEGARAAANSFPETALYCEQSATARRDMMGFEELRAHLYGLLDFPEGLVVEGQSDWGSALAL